MISDIVYFREIILESLQNVRETAPRLSASAHQLNTHCTYLTDITKRVHLMRKQKGHEIHFKQKENDSVGKWLNLNLGKIGDK